MNQNAEQASPGLSHEKHAWSNFDLPPDSCHHTIDHRDFEQHGRLCRLGFDEQFVSQQLTKQGIDTATNLALSSSNVILLDDFYQLHELVSQAAASSEDIRYILV